jgi:hypothetical protein
MAHYNRSIEELQEHAAMWWPAELKDKYALANILPTLLKTQDDFLGILNLSKNEPLKVFELIEATGFPANLFLKHLAVLADYGGEPIQRLGRSFSAIFPVNEYGRYYMEFTWKEASYVYEFGQLPIRGLGNTKLCIDGKGLLIERGLDGLMKDIIVILLHASASDMSGEAALDSCNIGAFLGKKEELDVFVKQRYLEVSRITGGADSNALGQLAQTEVADFLSDNLGDGFEVSRNGTIILEGYEKPAGMPFDVVVLKDDKKVGIEVSFQVTTNSVIERKSGQSANRQNLMHKNGYGIAYVIDGAGNFQRSSALSTICNHSDCTVAYTVSDFEVLANWIKEYLG